MSKVGYTGPLVSIPQLGMPFIRQLSPTNWNLRLFGQYYHNLLVNCYKFFKDKFSWEIFIPGI